MKNNATSILAGLPNRIRSIFPELSNRRTSSRNKSKQGISSGGAGLALVVGLIATPTAFAAEVPARNEQATEEPGQEVQSRACTGDDVKIWNEAVQDHPALAAQRERAVASRAYGSAAAGAKNPSFFAEVRGVPISEPLNLGRTPMGGIAAGIRVPIPWIPRLSAREAAKESLAQAAEYSADEMAQDLLSRAMLLLVDDEQRLKRAQVASDQVALLRSLSEIARANASVGRAAATDALLLEARAAALAAAAAASRSGRAAVRAQWRATFRELPFPECRIDVDTTFGPRTAPNLKPGLAISRRARVQEFEARMKAASQRESASVLSIIPEPTLSFGYVYRPDGAGMDGVDFISAGLSVPIPIFFAKDLARQDAARAESAVARAEKENFTMNALAQLRAIEARADVERQLLTTLRKEASPLAAAAFEVAQGTYSSGEGSVQPVLEAERVRLDLERAIIDATARLSVLEIRKLRVTGLLSGKHDAVKSASAP